MEILEPHDSRGWITAVIDGRWVQAKVYDMPSKFGINNGRVSKCSIGKTAYRNPSEPFLDQMDFSYNRWLNFDNLPEGVLDKVIAELENLPTG